MVLFGDISMKKIIASSIGLILAATTAYADYTEFNQLSDAQVIELEQILDFIGDGQSPAVTSAACGAGTAPQCNGTCPTNEEECKPNYGGATRPKTGSCECMKKAYAACGEYYDSTGGDGARCQYGTCPEGQTCQFKRGSGARPLSSCECVNAQPTPPTGGSGGAGSGGSGGTGGGTGSGGSTGGAGSGTGGGAGGGAGGGGTGGGSGGGIIPVNPDDIKKAEGILRIIRIFF